jgi:hypothetical protein
VKFRWLGALAALCVLTYLLVPRQPLIEDDYGNIVQARIWGPVAGWPEMLRNDVFRPRATSYWLLYSIERVEGLRASRFYVALIALHVLCTWLLFAILVEWPGFGTELAFFAAAFFAIYEGHQEAVMWISACNETLQFLFGAAAMLAWLRFLRGGGWVWLPGSLAAFCMALLSKESAVIWIPLMALPVLTGSEKKVKLAWLLPFCAAAAVHIALILRGSGNSFRFQDGSFSWHAPFLLAWTRSFWRVLWVWGLAALVFLAAARSRRLEVAAGLLWIGIALVPYSFLTYMTFVPSRQTYLASAGLALVVGAALITLRALDRRAFWAVAAVMLIANIGIIWTRKRSQFLARAEPTEQLIAVARRTSGVIYIECFPRDRFAAEQALHVALHREPSELVWDAEDAEKRHAAVRFCYAGR